MVMMMLREEQEKIRQISYAAATRYMSNANEALQKARKENNYYADVKYVRTACGVAYCGVLVALDAWLALKGVQKPKKPKRTSIDFYKMNVAELDGKMLCSLNTVYNVLHIAGYYDGERNVRVIKAGFESAYEIITKIKPEQEVAPDKAQKKLMVAKNLCPVLIACEQPVHNSWKKKLLKDLHFQKFNVPSRLLIDFY
jgi:hypothetical protein